MNTQIPILYAFIACIATGGLGAVFGVLWCRKHPKIVESVVDEAKKIEAGAQAAGKKIGL